MILRSGFIAADGQGSSGGQPRQITSSFVGTNVSNSLAIPTGKNAIHLLEIICGYQYITLSGTLTITNGAVTKTYTVSPTMVGSSIQEILMMDPDWAPTGGGPAFTGNPVTITLSPSAQGVSVASYLEVVYANR